MDSSILVGELQTKLAAKKDGNVAATAPVEKSAPEALVEATIKVSGTVEPPTGAESGSELKAYSTSGEAVAVTLTVPGEDDAVVGSGVPCTRHAGALVGALLVTIMGFSG